MFTVGLYGQVFETMTLAEDSRIDLSRCTMVFHIKHWGLTEWNVKKVRVQNITFSFDTNVPRVVDNRADDVYLTINYARGVYHWLTPSYLNSLGLNTSELFDINPLTLGLYRCSIDKTINPSTLNANMTCDVTFDIGSIFTHTFQVQTRQTLNETIDIKYVFYHRYIGDNSIQVEGFLNNTGSYTSYIHSIDINNITFYSTPTASIVPSSYDHSMIWFSIGINTAGIDQTGLTTIQTSIIDDNILSISYCKLDPKQNVTSGIFQEGAPITFVVRTLGNTMFSAQLMSS
jgi:hypothetical protein